MNKFKKFFLLENGQSIVEYVLTTVCISIAVIAGIKVIPLAFEIAFDKITKFYSYKIDELLKIVIGVVRKIIRF